MVQNPYDTQTLSDWCPLEKFRANAIILDAGEFFTEAHEYCKGWELSTLWAARACRVLSLQSIPIAVVDLSPTSSSV